MTVQITEEENNLLQHLYTRYNSYAALIHENESQYIEKYLQAHVEFSAIQRKICKDNGLSNITFMNFTDHNISTMKISENRTYIDVETGNVPTLYSRLSACEFLVKSYKETDEISFSTLLSWLGKEKMNLESEYVRLGIGEVFYDSIADKFFTKE